MLRSVLTYFEAFYTRIILESNSGFQWRSKTILLAEMGLLKFNFSAKKRVVNVNRIYNSSNYYFPQLSLQNKYYIWKNFRFSYFDEFTRFRMSWLKFYYFWKDVYLTVILLKMFGRCNSRTEFHETSYSLVPMVNVVHLSLIPSGCLCLI